MEDKIVYVPVSLLEDLEDYFDNRADADHDGENFVPNEEMRLLWQIQSILQKHNSIK